MKRIKLTFIFTLIAILGFSQMNWYPQNSGTNSVLFDIQFIDNYNGWACGNSGTILYTQDGGTNWYAQDPPPNNTYYALHFTNSQSGFACGYGGKVIHTTDGGNLWLSQTTNSDTYLFDIFFVDNEKGWAVGGDNGTYPSFISYREILYTSDGGATWIKQISQSNEKLLRSVFFADVNNGYAVGEGGEIMHTSNGGANWTVQAAYPSYEFRSVFFIDESHGWIVSEYLGLPHAAVLFRTDDAGLSWNEQVISEETSLTDIFFIDENNGWTVGGNGSASAIFYTIDGGTIWLENEAGTNEVLFSVYFNDQTNGWAVGNTGAIITTSPPIGINDNDIFTGTTVYPNPAINNFTINVAAETAEKINLYLINSQGQMVYGPDEIRGSESFRKEINTSSFAEGLYTLIIETQSNRTAKKIIIMR